jgi:exportin-2 (importin alpha re-exporter)
LFRSDPLFTEINHVLSKFGAPFLQLLENTNNMVEQNKSNPAMLKSLFGTLNLMMKLLYDLTCQDLAPVVEESMGPISQLLEKYLKFDDQSLHTDSDEESGPLEFVKAGIFEVLGLFVAKYEDAFGQYIGTFVQSSWTLLTTIGEETKYDILVSKALQFLTAVTRLPQHAQAFNNPDTLGQVVEKVILPNLQLRDSDMELFEDEPIEFIRRDLEGSDSDTRRRASTDFLRGLMAQYEDLVTNVVFKYIDHFLKQFAANPQANWRAKDTAVYLYSSVAAKGVVTAREGVKTLNPNVNVIDWFQQNIANDLVSESVTDHPIIKVDAIKYLYIFRSQISQEQWHAAFPLLVTHLASTNYVVYTYAAIAVERVLALTDAQGQPLVGKDAVQPLAKDLLEHLFKLVEQEKSEDKALSATKIQENEFLMRCIMRVLVVIRDGLVPLTDMLLKHLVEIVDIVSANPSNPRFCYYLFETVGAVVHYAAPAQPQALENTLYHPFASIIQNEVQDFIPYVFQLFAALLEANPSGTLPDLYKSLIPLLIKIDFWTAKGNVPGLVRLLSSMLNRAAAEFVGGNQVEPVLGIFKYLFQSKANEAQAFELLESILALLRASHAADLAKTSDLPI